MKCPKCRTMLELPAEISDGMPGIKYRVCRACGYTRAVTHRPRRAKLFQTPKKGPTT